MESNNYIQELIKYKKYFNSSVKEFNLLALLDIDELGLNNDKVISVTPLLKEIIEYALIPYFITEDELEEMVVINNDEKLFNDVDDVTTECCEYLNYLIENDCHHPTILLAKNLIELFDNYDFIIETLLELIDSSVITNPKIYSILQDIDSDIIDFIDETLFKLEDEIETIKTSKELIHLLKMCSLVRAKEYGLLISINNYYDENIWCKYSKNDTNTVSFASLMKKIEEIDAFFLDIEDVDKLIEIKKAYYLYKCNQYAYFKNKYKEDKILEKCKKI